MNHPARYRWSSPVAPRTRRFALLLAGAAVAATLTTPPARAQEKCAAAGPEPYICGIEIEVGPLLGVFEPQQRDDTGRLRYHYVVLDYLARYVSGKLRAADDADDARWVALDALESLPMLAETRAMIRKGVELAAV